MAFYNGPIDGDFESKSVLGLQKFLVSQKENPGPEDGEMGKATIRALQHLLQKKGFYSGTFDGELGKLTAKALQQWLKSEGEEPGSIDGIMGTTTYSALQRFLKYNRVTGEATAMLKTVFSNEGGSSGTYKVTFEQGFEQRETVSTEMYTELTASISGPIEVFTAGLESKSGFKYTSSTDTFTSTKVTKTIEIGLDKPCYIYQVIAQVPTRHGLFSMAGPEKITSNPVSA